MDLDHLSHGLDSLLAEKIEIATKAQSSSSNILFLVCFLFYLDEHLKAQIPGGWSCAVISLHWPQNLCCSLWTSLLGPPGLPGWHPFELSSTSLVIQMVKNPPAMWETWVWFLGWEDPLEEGMATHSSILAWRIPKDKGAWWATVHGGHKELDMTERLSTHTYFFRMASFKLGNLATGFLPGLHSS